MEEQILKILQQMQHQIGGIESKIDGIEIRIGGLEQSVDSLFKRMDGLEQRMDGLDKRMGSLEQRMDGLEQRMDRVEEKVTEIQLTIENELRPDIRRIAEGHVSLNEKLQKIDAIAEDVEETKLRVELVEAAVKRNGKAISKLNQVVFQ